MRIAVQGCCHGELDRIYKSIIDQQKSDGIPVELLLICGDFQALRNKNDLDCMAVPDKYKQLGDFYKYYNGDKLAPIPTVFIGGNHEASNYLWELFHGGFVCPNIYYLGAAGIVNFGGLRIGGLSGIFKPQHFNTGYFERQPLERGDIRSIYHVRRISTWKLSKLREPVDIILSHDWPLGIARHGNIEDLLSKKKFLRKEVESNTLGNPPAAMLLHRLKPKHWFSAHMHVKFEATVLHKCISKKALNPDEINIESSDEDENDEKQKITKFLALDKCLPNRKFIEFLDIPVSNPCPKAFRLDAEWLSIIKSTESYLTFNRESPVLPSDDDILAKIDEARVWIDRQDRILFPPDFCKTAPEHGSDAYRSGNSHIYVANIYQNPQTADICNRLGFKACQINPNGIIPTKSDQHSELEKAKSRALERLNFV